MNAMTILYFVGALMIFGLIVIAHEFGHFISARLVGIPVLEFSVGFGPKLFGWERKGTLFSIRAIPMGGFCKYMGEDDGDYDSAGALNNQPPWKRFVTVFSGPLMNFVLAFVAVVIYLSVAGFPVSVPGIYELVQDMPAQKAGLLEGDVITAIDGTEIPYTENGAIQMRSLIEQADAEKGIVVSVKRGNETMDLTMTPEVTENGGKQIGIIMDSMRARVGLWDGLRSAGYTLVNFTKIMLDGLKNLFFKGEGLEDTVGPVGMLGLMTREIAGGVDQIFNLIVIISLNLGIMNLLPLPALDGGRLVFITVEAIRRKPIKPEFEGWVHAGGFILLMGIILIVTYKDIVRLFTGGI